MYDNADPNKVNSTLILYHGICQQRRFQTHAIEKLYLMNIILVET